jgi:uncharacterized membrane protein
VSTLQSATHRRLLVVVGALLIGAIAGMVALWPSADELPDTGPPLEDLTGAEILAFEVFEGDPDPVMGGSGESADIEVRLLDGPDAGAITVLEDVALDGYPDLAVGDRVTLDQIGTPDGGEQYAITDFQRTPTLLLLLGVFVLAVLAIGRWHGLRSLFGLAVSLLIVVQFIVPAILAGKNPPAVALVGAVAVMIVTLYLAHGINEMTTAAIIGTSGALVLTVAMGVLFIDRSKITGFASDDAQFASFAVQGLDLQGLVLAGLIIAALGVLDDVTVSQASTVFALHDTDRTLSWSALFARAMRVGRDHIASVVNTLFLAYAGASLALLVLFSTSGVSTAEIFNSEVLAEEIVKIIVGSLGLIAAVPLTTALAAKVAIDRPEGVVSPAHLHSHAGGATPATDGAGSPDPTADAGDGPNAPPGGEIRLGMRGFERRIRAEQQEADGGATAADPEVVDGSEAPSDDPDDR